MMYGMAGDQLLYERPDHQNGVFATGLPQQRAKRKIIKLVHTPAKRTKTKSRGKSAYCVLDCTRLKVNTAIGPLDVDWR
eukprot:scaffold11584_cov160-Amphora_coffeaeformis.AAC.4